MYIDFSTLRVVSVAFTDTFLFKSSHALLRGQIPLLHTPLLPSPALTLILSSDTKAFISMHASPKNFSTEASSTNSQV